MIVERRLSFNTIWEYGFPSEAGKTSMKLRSSAVREASDSGSGPFGLVTSANDLYIGRLGDRLYPRVVRNLIHRRGVWICRRIRIPGSFAKSEVRVRLHGGSLSGEVVDGGSRGGVPQEEKPSPRKEGSKQSLEVRQAEDEEDGLEEPFFTHPPLMDRSRALMKIPIFLVKIQSSLGFDFSPILTRLKVMFFPAQHLLAPVHSCEEQFVGIGSRCWENDIEEKFCLYTLGSKTTCV
ncbi:hypothetical protein OROMI_014201 [Orobanche minor]